MKMGLVLLSWVWLHHFGRRGKNEYQQLLESQVQPEQSLLQQIRNFFSVPALSLPQGTLGHLQRSSVLRAAQHTGTDTLSRAHTARAPKKTCPNS